MGSDAAHIFQRVNLPPVGCVHCRAYLQQTMSAIEELRRCFGGSHGPRYWMSTARRCGQVGLCTRSYVAFWHLPDDMLCPMYGKCAEMLSITPFGYWFYLGCIIEWTSRTFTIPVIRNSHIVTSLYPFMPCKESWNGKGLVSLSYQFACASDMKERERDSLRPLGQQAWRERYLLRPLGLGGP